MSGNRIPIGSPMDFPEGVLVWRSLDAPAISVVVCRLDGVVYAIENRCSHQERPMDGGKREGQVIRCPHHGVCYDLKTGAVDWSQGFLDLIPCRTFAVEESADAVALVLPTNGD